MLTLIIAFLSLIVLVIIHEFGHFIVAKKFGVRVEEFGIGYPPRIFGRKFGETIYSLNLIPLGAFVRIYGEEGGVDDYRSFSKLKIWKRILIVLGGVLAFWLAAIIIFSFVSLIGVSVPVGDRDLPGIEKTSVKIIDVANGSPAEISGLKPGDVLLEVKSMRYESAQYGSEVVKINKIKDVQDFVKSRALEQLELKAERGGNIFTVLIRPRLEYPEGQGPTGVVLERFANLFEKSPWYQAPLQGASYTGKITLEALKGLYKFFADIFQGRGIPPEAQLAGPVGITIFLSRAVDYGPGFFLYFIGSLTVFLAIFNLFPIPALDGGKIVFLIIEKVRKKPVPANWEQGITILFFILLISMAVFVTVKFDIPRAVDFWKAGL